MSMNKMNLDYFKNIDTPNKAFWLGFLCADASVGKKKSLSIKQKDDILLKQFAKDIEFSGNIIINVDKTRFSKEPYYAIYIARKQFMDNLMNAGKTMYKHDLTYIPKSIPQEFIRDFIRGYFEGDGNINCDSTTGRWKAVIYTNYEILTAFKERISEAIGRDVGSIYFKEHIHVLSYGGEKVVPAVLDYLYYDKSVHGIKINKYRGVNYE